MRVLKQLATSQKVVILLSALTLILGVANLARGVLALRYSVRLPDLPTTVSLRYLAAMGGFWGIMFVICALGLSLFRTWGRWCTLAAATLYEMNAWANRLLFGASDYVDQIIPRDVALTVVFLLGFWIPLNLPSIKRVFREDEDGQAIS